VFCDRLRLPAHEFGLQLQEVLRLGAADLDDSVKIAPAVKSRGLVVSRRLIGGAKPPSCVTGWPYELRNELS
jgi:hypothetical protein